MDINLIVIVCICLFIVTLNSVITSVFYYNNRKKIDGYDLLKDKYEYNEHMYLNLKEEYNKAIDEYNEVINKYNEFIDKIDEDVV